MERQRLEFRGAKNEYDYKKLCAWLSPMREAVN
jgi:hypothetical protein